MDKGKILSDEVRVSVLDGVVSIFQVDPVGFVIPNVRGGLYPHLELPDLGSVVAWAYNLGYENGLKEMGNA